MRKSTWKDLSRRLEGELHVSEMVRRLYATDASIYRQIPQAVALPKSLSDLVELVKFASEEGTDLTPRSAGTSLAGQAVGNGIVVDVSRHFTKILEINPEEKWAIVQPGVIRDELNYHLKEFDLMFGPDTSTSNRCMMGGMVGNNSCGSTSIVFGTTRDHVLGLETVLSDGSTAYFKQLTSEEFNEKKVKLTLEGSLYKQIERELASAELQKEILLHYPAADIQRRNTGYALDLLLKMKPFQEGGADFNFCKLLTGSEGTLALTSEIKLNLVDLPGKEVRLVCAHFDTIRSAMEGARIAMKHNPNACELIDKVILDCTKENISQRKNRFFIDGDPAAILIIEFRSSNAADVIEQAGNCVREFLRSGLGYAFPVIEGGDIARVWSLRKAGLGLLGNLPGDGAPLACVEDTAVRLEDLPDYIDEFTSMMEGYGQKCVYYAHAGDGEIHLRPILDLRNQRDRAHLREITRSTADLVKRYRGSLSGEHGDGRVRGEFIPVLMGEKIVSAFRRIKKTWDPNSIFNPGKIVDTEPMDQDLRFEVNQPVRKIDTFYDFSKTGGIQRTVEKCNGSGDCRKKTFAGGTMCPSYRATLDEKDSTRGRANTIREILSHNGAENPFDHSDLKAVLELCLSCKACTSECPSSINMTMLKSEFLYQYYKSHRRPLRDRVFGYLPWLNQKMYPIRSIANLFMSGPLSGLTKSALGISMSRKLPQIAKESFTGWFARNYKQLRPHSPQRKVILFCDEFTDYLEPNIGIAAVKVLSRLNVEVITANFSESGRAPMSKGFLNRAVKVAERNVRMLSEMEVLPVIGIEPSAILGLRDEYPNLVSPPLREKAIALTQRSYTIDEYLYDLSSGGLLDPDIFNNIPSSVKIHGHCHQKSISDIEKTSFVLSLKPGSSVEVLATGCCGMAGSFGYEKEHYELSLKIAELDLFPALRKLDPGHVVVANGTSCRQQISEGLKMEAMHMVEVLATWLN